MTTERRKMLAGELYDPLDPELVAARGRARDLCHIELGERVFFNFKCVVLDVCPVRISSFTLFGPAVQIYTPLHPFDPALRRRQRGYARYPRRHVRRRQPLSRDPGRVTPDLTGNVVCPCFRVTA